MKIKEKFAYIDESLYPTIYEVSLRGFLWPLLSALFLIFVYPIPSRWVFKYVRKEQKRLKAVQQRIEDETPVTQEEARNLRSIIREAAQTFDKVVTERDKTISDQQNLIDSLRRELATAPFESAASVPTATNSEERTVPADYSQQPLSSNERALLQFIADSDGISEINLRSHFQNEAGFSILQLKYFLDRLLEKKLILARNTAGGNIYTSTPAGRENIMNVQITIDN